MGKVKVGRGASVEEVEVQSAHLLAAAPLHPHPAHRGPVVLRATPEAAVVSGGLVVVGSWSGHGQVVVRTWWGSWIRASWISCDGF